MTPALQLPHPELWPVTVDWELNFLHSPGKKAAAYWQALRGPRAMPARRELRPDAMKAFLPHASLVDVVPGGCGNKDYIVALLGGHAREVFGDIKGRRPQEIFPPLIERRWRRCFDLPYAESRPARLLSRASTGMKNWLACEALVAPLGEDNEIRAFLWVFASWPANCANEDFA